MKAEVKLQDFSLVSFIGKGSYADVTLVRKKENGKLYAMKALKKKYVAIKKQQTNVMLERNILSQVDHPFIVKLSYSFQNDRKLFFVLQYCPGGDLFGVLCKRKRLTQQEVQMNAAQIVLAIDYLHSKNIVYRDLKPENVILDSEGYIRLTDFGLSRVQLGQKALNICGTPEYIAPQVLNKEGASKPADWWCLGCIIYEMSVGLPPFYFPKNRQTLFDKIKSTEPKYPSALSPGLKSIIQNLLTKDYNYRLGTKNGAQQLKNHIFFAGLDWQALYNKQLKPIHKTKLSSQLDVSNFDTQFTECPLQQFSCSPMSNEDNNYPNFSYNKSAQNKFCEISATSIEQLARGQQKMRRREDQNFSAMEIENQLVQSDCEMEDEAQFQLDVKQRKQSQQRA